jgi:hypothetical protein
MSSMQARSRRCSARFWRQVHRRSPSPAHPGSPKHRSPGPHHLCRFQRSPPLRKTLRGRRLLPEPRNSASSSAPSRSGIAPQTPCPRSSPAPSEKRPRRRTGTTRRLAARLAGRSRPAPLRLARADKEIAVVPLESALSFAGTPDKQMLSVDSNKPITLKQLDFLMSSEAHITSSDLDVQTGATAMIPLDPKKIGELFASPRPDKNHYDHA